jgi:hypothetical protein
VSHRSERAAEHAAGSAGPPPHRIPSGAPSPGVTRGTLAALPLRCPPSWTDGTVRQVSCRSLPCDQAGLGTSEPSCMRCLLGRFWKRVIMGSGRLGSHRGSALLPGTSPLHQGVCGRAAAPGEGIGETAVPCGSGAGCQSTSFVAGLLVAGAAPFEISLQGLPARGCGWSVGPHAVCSSDWGGGFPVSSGGWGVNT